jgi:hypothetical protein
LNRTYRYRQLRRAFIFGRPVSTCWWCDGYVDRRLRFPHPDSPTIDHEVPPSNEREFFEVSRWRLCHYCCNRDRGRSGALPPSRNGHTPSPEVPAATEGTEWRGWVSPTGIRWSRDWGGGRWTGDGPPPPDPLEDRSPR